MELTEKIILSIIKWLHFYYMISNNWLRIRLYWFSKCSYDMSPYIIIYLKDSVNFDHVSVICVRYILVVLSSSPAVCTYVHIIIVILNYSLVDDILRWNEIVVSYKVWPTNILHILLCINYACTAERIISLKIKEYLPNIIYYRLHISVYYTIING
jgi:hypothetical protein